MLESENADQILSYNNDLTLSCASTFAFSLSNIRQTSICPFSAALCNGVLLSFKLTRISFVEKSLAK